MSPQNPNSNNSGNNLEQKLWAAADKLRNNMDAAEYKLIDIRQNDYILTPGRYVGFEEVEEDDEVFGTKMEKLTKELS